MSSGNEQAFFFGPPGRRLYAMLHGPAAGRAAAGAWLVCAPYGEECDFARQMLVEWARTLSGEGFWVMRFDYRGHGDSSGEFEQFTADDLLADVSAAAEELKLRTGLPCAGCCGLRLGATLAAAAAAQWKTNPLLVLWEPVVQGRGCIDEMLRSVVASRQPGEPMQTTAQMRQQMADGGQVFVRGRGLNAAICEAMESLDLMALGRPTSSPMLIVQTAAAPGSSVRRGLSSLHLCYSHDAPTDLSVVAAPPLWGGRLENEHNARVRPQELFGTTLAWIREHAPPQPSRRAAARTKTPAVISVMPDTADGERAVSYTVDGAQVRGVLHLPAEPSPGRPAVVIPPHGISRGGFNRLYVKLARELARAGWAALRFDGRGMGDSDGWASFETGVDLFLAVENGLHVEDAMAGIDFMEREVGASSAVLAGACGGGITSALVAARDERVLGVVFLEASLRYYAAVESTEAPPLWVYRRKVMSPQFWKRLLSFQIDFSTQWRWAMQRLRSTFRAKDGMPAAWVSDTLGPRANMGLIHAFRMCIERGKPMLCLFGETDNALYFEASREHLGRKAGAWSLLEDHVIAGADHNFSMPQHTGEMFRRIMNWLGSEQQPWMKGGGAYGGIADDGAGGSGGVFDAGGRG